MFNEVIQLLTVLPAWLVILLFVIGVVVLIAAAATVGAAYLPRSAASQETREGREVEEREGTRR